MESSSKATTSSTTPLNVAGYSFMRNYQNGSDRMSREGQLLHFLFQNLSFFFFFVIQAVYMCLLYKA